jgi:hypothetical protein
MAKSEVVNLFNYMIVRSASSVEAPAKAANYIADSGDFARKPVVALAPQVSDSPVEQLIFNEVFCQPQPKDIRAAIDALLVKLRQFLAKFYPPCDGVGKSLDPKAGPLKLHDLTLYTYLRDGDYFYLLPDRPALVIWFPWTARVAPVTDLLTKATDPDRFDVNKLVQALQSLFDGQPLESVVFDGAAYSKDYATARRGLFDSLYLCYIFRRQVSINLQQLIQALQLLHTLEALAIDTALRRIAGGNGLNTDSDFIRALAQRQPDLVSWNKAQLPAGFPLIADAASLAAFLQATPIIGPLIAQLYYYRWPFNTIKPIGVGDLKVVKQWLVRYVAGEISDIHNVMAGEKKERIHRRMEKTETTTSFTSEQTQDSTTDTQSTDRFELKKETESVIKQTLNVGANASVTANYNNGMVVANVGANFAYNRDSTDTTKASQNFWREIVSKAVTQVQSKSTQSRTVSQIFETVETNKHTFSAGDKHISGIYQWVDKEYCAQVFNYGKRMMFEFVVPEPAAYYVQSRLRAFEADTEMPTKPADPIYQIAILKLAPKDIDEAQFNILRLQYDLSDLSYPAKTRQVAFVDQESGNAYFFGERRTLPGLVFQDVHVQG